jgi:hypothetical protein
MLETTRQTGRPGYPVRAMVGLALVKALYALPTWTRTVALVSDHAALRDVLGAAPSTDAAYRFAAKLREHAGMLTACTDAMIAALHIARRDMGTVIAIDGSDLPAYANGQRYVSRGGALRERFSDPDATSGHRSSVSTRSGGGYYGYKVHAVVCAATGLPLAWQVETAKDSGPAGARPAGRRRCPWLHPGRVRPGPGLRRRDHLRDGGGPAHAVSGPAAQDPRRQGRKHNPPECGHGTWTFAGSGVKRGASKWRCPSGECAPASAWLKASRLHTLIPRTTVRWKSRYHLRGGVEREFGRLKNEWGALPLRVRRLPRVRLPRVRLHIDLTIMAQLASALAATRA